MIYMKIQAFYFKQVEKYRSNILPKLCIKYNIIAFIKSLVTCY